MAVYRYFIVWIYWFICLNFSLPGSLLKMETPFRKSFRRQKSTYWTRTWTPSNKDKSKDNNHSQKNTKFETTPKGRVISMPKNQGKTTHCWRVIYICFYKSREDNSWWRVISTNKIWGSNQVLSDCIWKKTHPAYIKFYI